MRDLEKDLTLIKTFDSAAEKHGHNAVFGTLMALFAASAVEGWTYAIKRAQAAEAEAAKLRKELAMISELQDQFSGRFFD